jgi:hypothetical protein
MFRPTLEAQNGSGGSRDAKHHQYASDEIHCTTSVGLTRIELVTSSLSGMRSNQLSYSPELHSGEMSLLPLSVTLNRGNQNLFFQH